MSAQGRPYRTTLNSYEVALALSEDQLSAYLGMANLRAILNKRDECQDWARKGLARVEVLKASNIPFGKSEVLPSLATIEGSSGAFSPSKVRQHCAKGLR